MTKLLEKAVDAVRRLPAHDQDQIAHAMLAQCGSEEKLEDIDPAHLADVPESAVNLQAMRTSRSLFVASTHEVGVGTASVGRDVVCMGRLLAPVNPCRKAKPRPASNPR